MQIDAVLVTPNTPLDVTSAGEFARQAETVGFDGVWVTEVTHSPWTLLTEAARPTTEIDVGSAIAVAFPRSPMVTSYTAWDLQRLADGRFVLGLGTQVKGHIERRFSGTWDRPGPRLREYVRVLRHLWDAWASGGEVDFQGEFYTIDLCPPDWRPEPIDEPQVPIYVAGVNDFNVQLAGHLCDGLHVHPLHSPAYLDEVVLPALARGAARGDRTADDVTVAASTFAVAGDTPDERDAAREAVREQIAFYGSTRTYRRIFEVHGWGDVCDALHDLSVSGGWDRMPDLVTDEMVDAFSVSGAWDELRERLAARYEHVDRVALYTPFRGEDHWERFV